MRKTYRSRLGPGVLTILAGLLFVTFGVCGIYVTGQPSIYFFGLFVLLGILATFAAITHGTARVVIDGNGIAKFTFHRIDFKFSWNEVESCSSGPVSFADNLGDDSFTFQKVEFRLFGVKKPVIIYDRDVWRPGFNYFLKDVREALSKIEIET